MRTSSPVPGYGHTVTVTRLDRPVLKKSFLKEKGGAMSSQFDQMVEYLDAAWHMKKEIVPCLIGPCGIGKTEAVLRHAKNVGAGDVVKIVASQILPNEVSGITMPDAQTKSMEIYDHYRLGHMKDGDILFFDELLEADQSVLKACLTLIESRELMSGRPLPDIQIVAATNPSVYPSGLPENVRQRFLFKKFEVDKDGTRAFIKDTTGVDVPYDVLMSLTGTDDAYNIFTPRSLTKTVRWLMAVPIDEVNYTAELIDSVWGWTVGTILAPCVLKARGMKVKSDVKAELYEALPDEVKEKIDQGSLQDMSFTEIVELLKKQPQWESIMESLKNVSMDDVECEEDDDA